MDEAIALLKDSDAHILEKKRYRRFIEKTFSFLNLLQSKQFQYILLQNNKNHLLLFKVSAFSVNSFDSSKCMKSLKNKFHSSCSSSSQ